MSELKSSAMSRMKMLVSSSTEGAGAGRSIEVAEDEMGDVEDIH